mmetsp:Transcript_1409/g.4783  ORF Transcript_1409/g.4783 Transcript_1409/m.4783 type:complete len:379 (-) Transcript_1409:72-1208(-)
MQWHLFCVAAAPLLAGLFGGIFVHPGLNRPPILTLPVCSNTSLAAAQLRKENVTIRPSGDEKMLGRLSGENLHRVDEALRDWGVAVLEGALSADAATALRSELLQAKRGRRPEIFVLEDEKRQHVLLNPFVERNVSEALRELGLQCGSAGGFLGQLIKCGSSLTEMAAIIVRRGASEQDYHPDTARRADDVKSITAFVALQRTTADMGPLWVRPRSHLCWTTRALRLSLPRGALVLMDSRLWHRGGEHVAGPARAVMYVTWAEPASDAGVHLPGGTTFALSPELWGRTRVPLTSGLGASAEKSACASWVGSTAECHGPAWGISDFLAVQLASCNADKYGASWNGWRDWLDCAWSNAADPGLKFVKWHGKAFSSHLTAF